MFKSTLKSVFIFQILCCFMLAMGDANDGKNLKENGGLITDYGSISNQQNSHIISNQTRENEGCCAFESCFSKGKACVRGSYFATLCDVGLGVLLSAGCCVYGYQQGWQMACESMVGWVVCCPCLCCLCLVIHAQRSDDL